MCAKIKDWLLLELKTCLKPINGFFEGKHPVESPDDLSYLLFQIYLTTIFEDASIEIRIICCLSPNTRMNTTLRQ